MSRVLRPWILATIAAVSSSAGCPRAAQQTGCKVDLDCGANQACNEARGICICIDDSACNPDEFCNVQGACQPLLECVDNGDCRDADNPNGMCDTTTGGCVTLSATLQCVLDSQCPFGSICEGQRCVPGCRDDGDCVLGTPCIDNVCDPTPGACSNASFCEFGQVCDAATHRCRDHAARGRLCGFCNPTDLFADNACALDDCLIDSSIPPTLCTNDDDCDRGHCGVAQCNVDEDCPGGGTCENAIPSFGIPGSCTTKICQGFFCGAGGCDDVTNPCPRGYVCSTLQIVSGIQCTVGSGSAECGAPSQCNGGGENGAVGFCSCTDDSQCVSPQFPNARCVEPGPNGACVIGTTCGPQDGLLCEDVR